MDALLSDICIGTSAAPTYLPAYYFETKENSEKVREFNLIDGAVAANNPVYINNFYFIFYFIFNNDQFTFFKFKSNFYKYLFS